MDWSFLIGLLLAIPFSIIANMMTPPVQRWWAQTNEARKLRRIEKLQAELKRLLNQTVSTQQSPPTQENRFQKEPRLEPGAFSSQMWDQGLESYQVEFSNVEGRYPTVAHNLRASISYVPFHGDTLQASPACWFYITKAVNARGLCSDSVTLGMLDKASVILFVGREHDFYIPEYHVTDGRYDELGALPKLVLEYGEWKVSIHLDGDNYSGLFKFKLTVAPNGSVSFAPSQ